MPYRRTEIKEPVSSAARTTDGSSEFFDVHEYQEMLVLIDVSVVSGTAPSLKVLPETSPDQARASPLVTPADIVAITATGKYTIKVEGNLGKHDRLSWTISGTTPSFTFRVTVVLKT